MTGLGPIILNLFKSPDWLNFHRGGPKGFESGVLLHNRIMCHHCKMCLRAAVSEQQETDMEKQKTTVTTEADKQM